MSILGKIFGDPNEKYIKNLQPTIEKIGSFEKELSSLSKEELKEKTDTLKERLKKGETLNDILPEAFSLIRESGKRALSQRHFDSQVVGGIVMHEGKIAEMKTGEGKTLAATLPAYLNAIEEKGVHIVTVNDYLAKRDTVWMGQIYHMLGISTGCIVHDGAYVYDAEYGGEEEDKERDIKGGFKIEENYLRPVSRKEAYGADITYGTNNEYAFDYLRDNLVYDLKEKVQRDFNFAIIDEVDSILIDEARTPLIISGATDESTDKYYRFARIISDLKEETHFTLDEKMRASTFTEEGQNEMIRRLGIDPWAENDIDTTHHLEAALKARSFFKKDKEYIVDSGEIIIIDESTGRKMPGRRWSGGLHQAVEAKEGVSVKPESKTYANVTFQNYFRNYKKLAGMTGTAITSAEEFDKVYSLEVVSIPTNRPMVRKDLEDQVYKTLSGKFTAVVREIKERNKKGQPVLVGTVAIEKNEYLAKLLEREGVSHQVLNAKNHEKEGEIIAQAGRFGAVTIATNMAGRGVDIILGGNPPSEDESEKVKSLGGLHVIGTERHEARRIDNQLRGRTGRQGDPGSSQFFVSLEDDLMRIFGGEKIQSLMAFLKVPEDQPIEAKMVSKSIESAQNKIEGMYFDARKHVLDYDDVINKHREVFYKRRKEILQKYEEGTLKEYILEIIENKEEYLKKEKEIGEQNMRDIEKYACLQIMDFFWMSHLDSMDFLKDQVRLRAYGQQDPLVEYKKEGHMMFRVLFENIENAISENLLKVEKKPQRKELPKAVVVDSSKSAGRNDPCPCNSGKKYKKCCYPKYG